MAISFCYTCKMLNERQKFISAALLVISGVVMTLFAGLLNYSVVSNNNHHLENNFKQIQVIDQQIEEAWLKSKELLQQQQTITLLLATQRTKDSTYLETSLKQLYQRLDKKVPVFDSNQALFHQLIEDVNGYKTDAIDRINDVYLEKILLEKENQEITRNNAFYSGFALFLQMMGVILILLKEIFR